MSNNPFHQRRRKTDSIKLQLPKVQSSPNHEMPELTRHDEDGTCEQPHKSIMADPPPPSLHNNSVQTISPCPSNTHLTENSKSLTSNIQEQLPFTPECDFEVEVFRQWKAGHPAYQQLLAPSGEIHHTAACDWNNTATSPGQACTSMTDSGVDFTVPPQFQDATNQECPLPSTVLQVCNNPDQCALSPDMVEAMQRFSVAHICEYEQAKRLLVDKIVNKVLQNAAPRIMALLEEELQKREEELDMEMGEYEEDVDSKLESKL
ncbi:hypothetical protein B0H65DRAFT_509280 [Neurospora tetraspora]|uniref:Uncharacterized protein n=1 Tax=Neurospora tetraspora TaxID=94610 RepID=A0AAE0JGP2_9PEZI|nr:hypothetical protein B0H65DRAFT_509280 [Neurospora tetraspora]